MATSFYDYRLENRSWSLTDEGLLIKDYYSIYEKRVIPYESIKDAHCTNKDITIYFKDKYGNFDSVYMNCENIEKAREVEKAIIPFLSFDFEKREKRRRFRFILSIMVLLIVFIFIIINLANTGSSSSGNKTATCRVCHEEFEKGSSDYDSV